MALIHHTASAGSLEKSIGRATLSSVVFIDMDVAGITGSAGNTKGCLGDAGGTALCLDGLGFWGVEVEGTVVKSSGEDDCSSSLLGLLAESL